MLLILLVLALSVSCNSQQTSPYRLGAIYSISSGDGGYFVCKILKQEDDALLIARIKERHISRPGYVSNQQVSDTIAHADNAESVEIILLSEAQFKLKSPRMIAVDKVSEAEMKRIAIEVE